MRRLLVALAFFAYAANLGATCDFQQAKQDAEVWLKTISIKAGGEARYAQVLEFANGTREVMPEHADYEFREVAFAILHTDTCQVEVLVSARRIVNGRLSPPFPERICLAPRAFGPIWNDFNTQTTTGDAKQVVIGMWWRFFSREGSFFYVPYSADLAAAFPELAQAGRLHFGADMEEALSLLRNLQLISPDLAVELRGILPLIFAAESIDPYEFKVADAATRLRIINQPFVTLGANGDIAYTLKVSSAGAKGPMQMWYKSCMDVRKDFPSARLDEGCNGGGWGSHSHVANIMAAALEYKLHRATLARFLGAVILERRDLPRLMMASYNGGPGHVIRAIRKYGRRWDRLHATRSLKGETVDYLLKYDFLAERLRRSREENASAPAGSR